MFFTRIYTYSALAATKNDATRHKRIITFIFELVVFSLEFSITNNQ